MPLVRRFAADEWHAYRDLRLRALADSPDAFGSTLEIEQEHSDAHWAERLSSSELSDVDYPLVAVVDAELVGLVWGRIDPSAPETAHVYQMWVEPKRQGVGVGTALLDAVISWARKVGCQRAVLRVTCGDTAARRLYERAGFVPLGGPKPIRAGSALLAQTMSLAL